MLVIVSASMRHALRERLDKYILYGDEARRNPLVTYRASYPRAVLVLNQRQYSC